MALPVEIDVLLLASAVIAVGTVLHGSIGFGLGTFSVPLLLLIDPGFVPGPMLALAFVLTILLYTRHRESVRTKEVGWGILGRILGTLAAVAILSAVSGDTLALLAGLMVLGGVALLASGIRIDIRPTSLVAAGSLSGFMGTIASVGGPPMGMVYAGESGPRIRGTLSGIFVAGTAAALVGLAAVGRFGLPELARAAVLLPAMLSGFLVSRYSAQFLDRGYIRPAILVVSGISAVLAVIRYAV